MIYTEEFFATNSTYPNDDLVQLVDSFTNENVNFKITTSWRNEPMSDLRVDGIIYRKKGSVYYKRVYMGNINVRWFGAKGDNVSDDTLAFVKARNLINSFGGGEIDVPDGNYRLKDFVIDQSRIVFKGTQYLSGYESIDNSLVTLLPVDGANFIARLKIGTVSNAAYSGFRDILFDGENNCEYGCFIDCGMTILERCIFNQFEYGCVISAAGNMNIIRDCLFSRNKYVGFAVTEEQSSAFLHPNIQDISPATTSKFIFEGNKLRQNGFGMVIRESVNTHFQNCVFESNIQTGVYFLRTDNSSIYNNKISNCWIENNYDNSYLPTTPSFSFDGNRMFLLAPNIYQLFENDKQIGFQLIIDSQTRNNSGGSGSNYVFDMVELNPVYDSLQKSVKIISAYNIEFNHCGFTGNTNGRFSMDNDTCFGVKILKPYGRFLTNLLEPMYSGIYISSKSKDKEQAEKGAVAAPVYFPLLQSDDYRISDPNILHSYLEGTFDPNFRIGGDEPFLVSDKIITFTKIGKLVHIEAKATIEVNKNTTWNDVFYTTNLPFEAANSNNIIGNVFINPIGGGATVLNNGISLLKSNLGSSALGITEIFPLLTIGMKYNIMFKIDYNTKN